MPTAISTTLGFFQRIGSSQLVRQQDRNTPLACQIMLPFGL
jgi:hypothetical protein